MRKYTEFFIETWNTEVDSNLVAHMASHLKATTIITLIVGVQFELMGAIELSSIIFNSNLLKPVASVTVVLAAEVQSSTLAPSVKLNSGFIPPRKGAPISTQGSGTR